MTAPAWVALFQTALDAEHGDRSWVAALATVDHQGRPQARMVVLRRIEPDGSCWIATDARSAKVEQLRRTPLAELVCWLPGRREQFRLAGPVAVVSHDDQDPRRQELWQTLSDPARGLFFSPDPGTPLRTDPAGFTASAPADRPVPRSFELLILQPERVERLELTPFPHRRLRWSASAHWVAEALNP